MNPPHSSPPPPPPPPPQQQQQQKYIFPKCSLFFLPILLTPPIIFIYLQSPLIPFIPLSSPSPSLPITFLPLKDLRLSRNPTANNTWFMSSLPDNSLSVGDLSYLHLPSGTPPNRLLCLSAANPHDGARNSYALASPRSLPPNSTLLPGLTFVSDTFYDYANLWHGLAAILPFASWHAAHGCMAPQRWVLFHWGEARRGMGMWVEALAEVSTGEKVRVAEGRAVCFEEAVVMRRGDVGMSGGRKEEVYDMMRCRAREYCGLERRKEGEGSLGDIRMTLFFRVGFRGFKNETKVKGVFERECGRVEGCKVRLVWAGNLTFCDQVWALLLLYVAKKFVLVEFF